MGRQLSIWLVVAAHLLAAPAASAPSGQLHATEPNEPWVLDWTLTHPFADGFLGTFGVDGPERAQVAPRTPGSHAPAMVPLLEANNAIPRRIGQAAAVMSLLLGIWIAGWSLWAGGGWRALFSSKGDSP